MKRIFYGRVPFKNATSLLQFQKKGITQQLLHNLKYRGQEDISYFFGKWLGHELRDHPDFTDIDLVVPVPIHRKKLKQRGYNQVTGFGKEIAMALKVPFNDSVLLKPTHTPSQVFKERFKRYGSSEAFTMSSEENISGKHILLVDDIVTTGATLEICAQQLLKNENVSLSVATIAVA
ncbi:MAG: phosphoribosyltransferase family protein [Bacteroidota bacterium]